MMLQLLCACNLLFVATDTVRYTRLTLLDGQVITGLIEHEDADEITVRVIKDRGKINYLQRVATAHLLKREFVDLPDRGVTDPRSGESAEPKRVADTPVPATTELAAIFEEWRIRNVEVASQGLLALVNRVPPDQLGELDELTRREFDCTLAEFTARVHLENALRRSRNGFFRLFFLSPFTLHESRALLQQALHNALDEQPPCAGHPDVPGICEHRESIAQWLAKPRSYDGDATHAARLAVRVSRALGMTRELIRICQALRYDRAEIVALLAQSEELSTLLSELNKRVVVQSHAAVDSRTRD